MPNSGGILMDWQECNNKKLVKEISIDKNLVKSLIDSSERKYKSNKKLELDEITACTKVSLIYDSIREILEAIAIQEGFKIYSHECFCSFLKEILGLEGISREFDKFRRLRNQINYYGKNLKMNEAKILLEEMNGLRNKMLDILKKHNSV